MEDLNFEEKPLSLLVAVPQLEVQLPAMLGT